MRLDAKNSESIRDFENWVKGELYGPRKEAKETQPMSDTLQEREDQMDQHQVNRSGVCEIPGCPCRGWSAQETASKEVIDTLRQTGPSELADYLEREHQPAAQGGGDDALSLAKENHYVYGSDRSERLLRAVMADHEQHHSLVAERERLLAGLRQAHNAALVFADSRHLETAQAGLLKIAADVENVLRANEQRSTSE